MRRVVCSSLLAAALVVSTARTAPARERAYSPPVNAPIVDPFRLPATPYGPGNRGLEYATAPGTEVHAIGAGEVIFAGSVAGALHVTVRHPDGLRSSYSFLAAVRVHRGDRVGRGDIVGIAGARLHLGVREGDAYIDPARLFDGAAHVRLVPLAADDGDVAGERRVLAALVHLDGRVHDPLADRVMGWLADRGEEVVRASLALPPVLLAQRLARVARDVAVAAAGDAGRCTGRDVVVPPSHQRRLALLVGGLGSSSEHAAIDDLDAAALGYARPDVLRFSYGGGRVPDPTDAMTDISTSTYGRQATQQDLHTAALALADLLLRITAAEPDVRLDVFAHSLGGVVIRLAIDELERRGALPRSLGLVVTLASPHAGAPLAWLAGLGPLVGLDPGAPSPRELAPGSAAVPQASVARAPGPRFLTIAARGDLVVPAVDADLPGAVNVVVPIDGLSAHSDLPGSPAVQREVRLALAGLAPACRSRAERVAAVVVPELLDGLERAAMGRILRVAG